MKQYIQNFAIDFNSEGGGRLIVVIGGQLRITYQYGYGSAWSSFVNGNWQYLADAPNIGTAKHVSINVKGNAYTVDVNSGEQKSTITSSVAGQGPVQLIIEKDRFVDNFAITALP